jgi:hypothetical protein
MVTKAPALLTPPVAGPLTRSLKKIAGAPAIGFGVGDGDGLGVTVGAGVAVGLGLGDGVGDGVTVGLGVGVAVGFGVAVGVGDGDGLGGGVGVTVGDGVGDGVGNGGFPVFQLTPVTFTVPKMAWLDIRKILADSSTVVLEDDVAVGVNRTAIEARPPLGRIMGNRVSTLKSPLVEGAKMIC